MNSRWLLRLDHDGEPSSQLSGSTLMTTALAELGDGPVRWAIAGAHRNADQILEQVPDLGTGPRQIAMVRQGTEIVALLTMLELRGVRISGGEPTMEREIIADFVRRRIPIEDVWQGNRASHQWWQREMFEACDRLCEPALRGGESQLIAQTVLAIFNALSIRISEDYAEEAKRWVSTQAALEDEAVRQVLAEEFVGDEARITAVLRYGLAGWSHLAAVAWIADERGTDADLHRVAEGCLRQLGATQRVAIRQGGAMVWAWGGFRSGSDVCHFEDLPVPPVGVRIAFGAARDGVAGFRQSHLEAHRVYSLAVENSGIDGCLLTYRSLGSLTLLLENRTAAEQFARDELGGLFGAEIRLRELRETLRAYIETRSPQAVARRIHVARNTVGYRIRQAEGILGHAVLERPSELWCALVIADVLEGSHSVDG
ncbi:Sugar diacid utilization regulator [Gordonia paraffinivorans]|uniref:Sugar diacid utilization regulator n=1 Tax=Gordonia paraffinivorans TaxID=175628 RepID=A0ABD7UY22_9ACTN|nr:Sugar diacid utilization regulator [Gordonia paraffinivorans]